MGWRYLSGAGNLAHVDVDEEAIRRAWVQACDDLGIDVIAPASVNLGSEMIRAIALLPQFGAPKGMVIFGHFSASQRRAADEVAIREGGYGFSYLSANYETYDRSLFTATLDDWGWSDNARASPDWYTGEAWGA